MTETIIRNCHLYNAGASDERSDILVEGKTIRSVDSVNPEIPAVRVLDAGGRTVIPGLIDIHVQGAGGADVLDATSGALETISRTLASLGTTTFLATTLYKPESDNKHITNVIVNGTDLMCGAKLLGIYLESPFVSMEKRGGILPDFIASPSREMLDRILDMTGPWLRMMIIAPELEGSLELIEKLVTGGVVAAFGHSNAGYEQAAIGFETGLSHVTHMCNAMAGMHHRQPGPMLAILEAGHVSAELISDGRHVHPAVMRMLFHLMGPKRLICISDGVAGTGLPNGKYTYNEQPYISKDGAACYTNGTLIGTTMGLKEIVDRFMKHTNCSFTTAVDMVTRNPARLLGISERKGRLAPGMDADIVVLDEDGSVWATLVEGKVVYEKKASS